MRAHQLDDDGVIVNTIIVDSLDFMPGLADADAIGGVQGDSIVDGILIQLAGPTEKELRIERLKAAIERIEDDHPITPRQLRELALIVRYIVQAVAPGQPPVHGLEVANTLNDQIVALRAAMVTP